MIPQRFDPDYVIPTLFSQNLQEIYEYILIISNIRQKYEEYGQLQEDEKIYLR